jgi:hypothetical protein
MYRGTEAGDRPVSVSGWDSLAWFAENPSIAQLYIPSSGMSTFLSTEALTVPTRNPRRRAVQKMIGIDFDLSGIKWESRKDFRGNTYEAPAPGGRMVTCWECHGVGVVPLDLHPRNPKPGKRPDGSDPRNRTAYRMSNRDKKVIQSFLAQQANHKGKVLDSDGKVLDKMGLGGGQMAQWETTRSPKSPGAVLVTGSPAGQISQTFYRFLRKAADQMGVTLLYGDEADECPVCFGSGDEWLGYAYHPKGWDHAPTEAEIRKLMEREGFREFAHDTWEIRESGGKVMHPKAKLPGTLHIARTKRPLVIARRRGGSDYDANDFALFKEAARRGYDGVFIWDYAQSEEHGNVSHASIGLFKHALPALGFKSIPAMYQEYDYKPGTPEMPRPKTIDFGSLKKTEAPAAPAKVAARYASMCSQGISAAWISPKGKVIPAHLTGHGRWAVEYLYREKRIAEIAGWSGGRLGDLLRTGWVTEKAIEVLLDDGWVRVSNWKEIEAYKTPDAAMKSAANLVMGCALEWGSNPETMTVFLWRKVGKTVYTVPDFIQAWGGRRMVEDLFESLLEVA